MRIEIFSLKGWGEPIGEVWVPRVRESELGCDGESGINAFILEWIRFGQERQLASRGDRTRALHVSDEMATRRRQDSVGPTKRERQRELYGRVDEEAESVAAGDCQAGFVGLGWSA